jgi:hypothetical protein
MKREWVKRDNRDADGHFGIYEEDEQASYSVNLLSQGMATASSEKFWVTKKVTPYFFEYKYKLNIPY